MSLLQALVIYCPQALSKMHAQMARLCLTNDACATPVMREALQSLESSTPSWSLGRCGKHLQTRQADELLRMPKLPC